MTTLAATLSSLAILAAPQQATAANWAPNGALERGLKGWQVFKRDKTAR